MTDWIHTIPGKPPVFVTIEDQDRCRLSGQRRNPPARMNRRRWTCELCPKSGRGLGNLAQHRRKVHGLVR